MGFVENYLLSLLSVIVAFGMIWIILWTIEQVESYKDL